MIFHDSWPETETALYIYIYAYRFLHEQHEHCFVHEPHGAPGNSWCPRGLMSSVLVHFWPRPVVNWVRPGSLLASAGCVLVPFTD